MYMDKILKDKVIDLVYKMLSPLSDKAFCIIQHRIVNGQRLNIRNPYTYNEKIQWIKVFDHNPIYHQLVDKIEVRKWVSERIGNSYLIPIVGGPWDNCNQIDYELLPNQFVLKCTHDSGGILICHDKSEFDKKYANRFLANRMKHDYYFHGREWAYKGLIPKVYAEKYMVDESGIELKDYKIFCFNGVPKVIQVDFGRYTKHQRNLYTTDWKYISAEIKYPTNPDYIIEKPVCLDEMLEVAAKLSDGLVQSRVDLYIVYDRIYFGEITLYHGSGCEKFRPSEFGNKMGELIKLPS